MVAWRPLPCDIVAAGSGQCKVEVEVVAIKRKKVTINWMCGCVSGGMAALPCNIVAAGRGQHKVEVAAKMKKKGNNQPEVQLREWWHGSTAMRHCHGRQWAAPSGSGGNKKKKGKN